MANASAVDNNEQNHRNEIISIYYSLVPLSFVYFIIQNSSICLIVFYIQYPIYSHRSIKSHKKSMNFHSPNPINHSKLNWSHDCVYVSTTYTSMAYFVQPATWQRFHSTWTVLPKHNFHSIFNFEFFFIFRFFFLNLHFLSTNSMFVLSKQKQNNNKNQPFKWSTTFSLRILFSDGIHSNIILALRKKIQNFFSLFIFSFFH